MADNQLVRKKDLPASRTADPRDEPSAEWGWHGTFPVAAQVFGWFAVIAILLLMTATHENKTSWVFICCFGVGLALVLVYGLYKRRNAWRRR